MIVKALAIAIFAGALAALPFAVLFTIGMDLSLIFSAAARYIAFGVFGSLVVGLPIALLIFRLIRSDRNFGKAELILTANGVAIVFAAILALSDGWFGAFLFGLPITVAANVYAIAGWRYILQDLREEGCV